MSSLGRVSAEGPDPDGRFSHAPKRRKLPQPVVHLQCAREEAESWFRNTLVPQLTADDPMEHEFPILRCLLAFGFPFEQACDTNWVNTLLLGTEKATVASLVAFQCFGVSTELMQLWSNYAPSKHWSMGVEWAKTIRALYMQECPRIEDRTEGTFGDYKGRYVDHPNAIPSTQQASAFDRRLQTMAAQLHGDWSFDGGEGALPEMTMARLHQVSTKPI